MADLPNTNPTATPIPAPQGTAGLQPVGTTVPAPQGKDTIGAYSTPQKAIYSASTATDKLNTINGAVNDATKSLADQQAKNVATGQNNPNTGTPTGGMQVINGQHYNGLDRNGKPLLDPNFSAQNTANTPLPAEVTAASTGHQWAWTKDGQQVEIPAGTASHYGMSDTPPPDPIKAGKQITSTVTPDNGNGSIVQFADGSYGKVGIDNKYLGTATQQDMQTAQSNSSQYQRDQSQQKANDVHDKLTQITNGTYPLTPDQQSIIEGIKSKYAEMIVQQQKNNANLTGGTTIAQNMYGMGNSQIGMGAISQTITDGISKIADLNNEMSSNVAKMKQAMQTDNFNQLNTIYNQYQKNIDSRQSQIDKMNDATQTEANRQKDAIDKREEQRKQDINGLLLDLDKASADDTTKKKILAILNSGGTYAQALALAGDSLATLTGKAGEYQSYSKLTKSSGLVPLDYDSWQAKQDSKELSLKSKEAYATSYGSASGKAQGEADSAVTVGDYGNTKRQDKLEHNYSQTLLKQLSNRGSGSIGIQDAKVNQALHVHNIVDQMTDGKGGINLSSPQYRELVIGVANLVSGSNNSAEGTINGLQQGTFQGDFNKAYNYIMGDVKNASSQAIYKQLSQSIDNQGVLSQQIRDNNMGILYSQRPTGLDPARAERLEKGKLASYTDFKQKMDDKRSIDNYGTSNPATRNQIQGLYSLPGQTDSSIAAIMKANPAKFPNF